MPKVRLPLLLLLVLISGAAGVALMAFPARAATYTVANLSDSGPGSLRDAITLANAAPGADTINFSASVTGSIVLASPLPVILDNLTISGPGANLLTVTGNNTFRIFNVNGGVTASISGLTIANGSAGFAGGGGISNLGTLTVANVTFSNNAATFGGGGGVYNFGTLTVSNSTFTGNSADQGAGINTLGPLTVVNSTFSSNIAALAGGGINVLANSLTSISFSTFSGNSAAIIGGGNLYNLGLVQTRNIILAGGVPNNCAGLAPFINAGGGLATDASCPSFPLVTSAQLNLGPLANNGGPTQTHALLPGSVAIDTAAGCTDYFGATVTQDQRGVARPQGPQCDVGAYEVQVPFTPTPTATVTLTATPTPTGTVMPQPTATATRTLTPTVTATPVVPIVISPMRPNVAGAIGAIVAGADGTRDNLAYQAAQQAAAAQQPAQTGTGVLRPPNTGDAGLVRREDGAPYGPASIAMLTLVAVFAAVGARKLAGQC